MTLLAHKIRIAHIINPVIVPESSDLFCAQPISFESMRCAVLEAESICDVELWAAVYPEDQELVPTYFNRTQFLDRSVLDMGSFEKKRKLPFLQDILSRLYEHSSAEYFIYSNVDIAVQKSFYVHIERIIRKYDSFIINRRTIPGAYTDPGQLLEMYKEIGKKHPGFDCFIFPRSFVPNFNLHHIIIGANYIGKSLALNLMLNSRKFKVFKNEHLTFHIGEDRVWQNSQLNSYGEHNLREYRKILTDLRSQFGKWKVDALKYFYFDNIFRKPFQPRILKKFRNSKL